MSLQTKDNFRTDIAGLRAWAVLAVVLYHFGVPGFGGGFVGVDVFFVISGFLMTRIILNGLEGESSKPFSVFQFYLSRARRIVPALLFLCVVLLVLGWFILPFTDYKLLGIHVLTAVLFASNIQFWREAGYFDADSHDKWLLHTWSLSVEWQFYLVFPLILWAVWTKWPTRKGVFAVMAGLLLVSLGMSVWLTEIKSETAFFLLPTRAWEMLAGGLVAICVGRDKLPVLQGRQRLLETMGFLMLAVAVMTANSDHWPGAAALLPVLGTVFVIRAQIQSSILTATPVMQRLGEWSYSIYLWHWPVVVALVYLDRQHEVAPVLAGLALSVLFGWMSYRWVEPLGRLWQHWTIAKSMFVFGLAVTIVGSGGLMVRLLNGLPGRLSPQVEDLAAAANDINPLRDKSHNMGGDKAFKSHVYGGPNVKAVVLGDSHASTIVTAVQAAQTDTKDGVLGMSYTSCPTLFEVRQERSDLYCADFNEWAIAQIEKLPNTVPVIIVNRYSAYLYGNKYSSNIINPTIYFDNKPIVEIEDEKRNEIFIKIFTEKLENSMCRLAKKRQVYIMRPLPEMPKNVPKAMSRSTLIGEKLQLGMPMDLYLKRNKLVWEVQDSVSLKCNLKIINPIPVICDDNNCPGSYEGKPIYYDDNHLSKFGAEKLIEIFRPVLSNFK